MGKYYRDVPMAWFWARIYKRTPRLGYYVGSYQTLIDALVQKVQAQGGAVNLNTHVSRVEICASGLCLQVDTQRHDFDAVLVTASPKVMLQLAPMLPADYLEQLRALRWLGALTVILALDRPMTKDLYWVNLPHGQFPFLAFVEHTNYQSPEHYGGDHIIYLGDYPDHDQPHATMSKEELLQEFLPSLTKFNPHFDPSWVRKSWLFRMAYAQPVPTLNFSRQVPQIRTPLPNLYFASMSQVYPWDRGTNYAVEMGQRVARMILEDAARK